MMNTQIIVLTFGQAIFIDGGQNLQNLYNWLFLRLQSFVYWFRIRYIFFNEILFFTEILNW